MIDISNLKKYIFILYVVQLISIIFHAFAPVILIVIVLIDYSLRSYSTDTLLQSHLRWQIRTFWFVFITHVITYVVILLVMTTGLFDYFIKQLDMINHTHHYRWILYVSLGIVSFSPDVLLAFRAIKGLLFLRQDKAITTATYKFKQPIKTHTPEDF